DTGEVLASDLTNRRVADCVRLPGLLDRIDHMVYEFRLQQAQPGGERRPPMQDHLRSADEKPISRPAAGRSQTRL
ncbi:MAG: hypothetical protein PVJ04_15275, partial [Gemmatimonadota bacterium]